MGFINATYELGKLYCSVSGDPKFKDIDNFLQLPMPVIDDDVRSGRVIRVWLNVKNKDIDCLEVTGIEKIDLTDYIRSKDQGKVWEDKRKYLYREPSAKAAKWKFTPVYKLGPGVTNGVDQLLGKNNIWRGKDKKSRETRFYKIQHAVLQDYEASRIFSEGSLDILMKELEKNVDKIASLWSDLNRSYILVFGINDCGCFLYPGQISTLVTYFKTKLKKRIQRNTLFTCSV